MAVSVLGSGLIVLLALVIVAAIVIASVAGWRALLATTLLGIALVVVPLVVVVLYFGSSRESRGTGKLVPSAGAETDSEWRDRVEKAIAVVASAKTEPAAVASKPSSSARKKPAWADAPPGLADGVYQMVVTVGPYKTWEECERALDEKLREGVDQYVETYAERDPDLDPRAVAHVHLPTDYVRKSVVKDFYCEDILSRTPAIGSMIQMKVLLGFDRQANAAIQEAARNVVVAERIRWSGIGLAGVLLSLLVAYAYLKTDLATQGVYRGRLRFAAVVMILGVCAAAVLAVAA